MSEDPTKRFPKAPGDNGEDKLDRLFAAVEALRSELHSEVSSLRSELRSEVSSLRSELATLSETVEHRLYDTRPMWEAVLAEMQNLKTPSERSRKPSGDTRNHRPRWAQRHGAPVSNSVC